MFVTTAEEQPNGRLPPLTGQGHDGSRAAMFPPSVPHRLRRAGFATGSHRDLLPMKVIRAIGLLFAMAGAHACLFLHTVGAHAGSLPAFPGAEGFGAAATGGRGGRVLYVTTLAASGPGSLQWALDQPGPRYVLFKISGLIDSLVHLRHGDVTIAGETSPGGITVRGFITDEQPYQDQAVQPPRHFSENWILRNVRMRPGADGPDGDGLRLRYTRNAIADGVSVGNATDEEVEISFSSGITVQRSIIAETVGDHAFYGGMLINYANPVHGFPLDRISIHHNAFVRVMGRLPEASRESHDAARSRLRLEISNNLYWDPTFFMELGANTGVATDTDGNPFPVYTDLNLVGNRMIVRPSYPYGMVDDVIARRSPASRRNRLFVEDNTIDRYPALSDWQLFYCCNDFQTAGPDNARISATQLTRRNAFPAVAYQPGAQLPDWMVRNAGTFPRDPMDKRLLHYIATGKIVTVLQDRNPAGDALLPAFTGAAPAPPADTDADGMPDAWERSKGLDPAVPGANAMTLSRDGYTNLEVYLHERAAAIAGG